jgi:DNA-binding NarL/FixJ family response regulator
MNSAELTQPLSAAWQKLLTKVASLSSRELEVFRQLAEGESNRTISYRLQISERTVKAHMAQILTKLNVESRMQAALIAFAWATLDVNEDSLVLPSPPKTGMLAS